MLTLTGSTFTTNLAILSHFGGALLVERGDAYVEDCVFDRNFNDRGSGGAIFVDYEGFLEVAGSTFTGNWGYAFNEYSSGGAISSFDGALGVVVRDSVFVGNLAENGAAILVASGGLTQITGNVFDAHQAFNGGTVALSGQGTAEVSRNLFIGNEGLAPGLLVSQRSGSLSVLAVNNTFLGNIAYGDALTCGANRYGKSAAVVQMSGHLDFVNNLVAETFGCGFAANNNVTLSYNAFWDNTTHTASGLLGDDVVVADPMLVGVSYDGDPSNDAPWPAAGSPLIDAGDPSVLDPDGTISDIGAYPFFSALEIDTTTTTTTTTTDGPGGPSDTDATYTTWPAQTDPADTGDPSKGCGCEQGRAWPSFLGTLSRR
jgi:hypothetical protein